MVLVFLHFAILKQSKARAILYFFVAQRFSLSIHPPGSMGVWSVCVVLVFLWFLEYILMNIHGMHHVVAVAKQP